MSRPRRLLAGLGVDTCRIQFTPALVLFDILSSECWTKSAPPRAAIDSVVVLILRSALHGAGARAVPAVGAIDGPACLDLEEMAGIELVGDFSANLPAAVANDELPLFDRN